MNDKNPESKFNIWLDMIFRILGAYCLIDLIISWRTDIALFYINLFMIAAWIEVEWRRWGKELANKYIHN
ncbi:hypothetical protein [Serratia nevei]|uniref:hypothetical protein n=1 Tax=Serratia nevei TaxID=2703794 RepID=UPI002858A127|nr:hypothetical protein [Serratia nevei]MDR8482133.1 hypothetical protein [Serratia nevei]